ncbi:hypothetical protein ACVMAJ_006233 [Bradyrhizobium sp. USDA 4448]
MPPMRGDGTERDLGLAELGGIGGDDEITHHGEFAAAAERVARDRRDGRLPAARDAVAADRGEILGEHVDEALRLHLLDVGTGGKGLFAAGHDDAADRVIGFEIVDGRGNLAKDAEGERVEHLRPVQLDEADRALAFDDDVFERAHAPPTRLIGRAMCPLARMPSRGWNARGERVPRTQAMNMRAAEASVSSVPTPMKILPIREL